MTDSEAPEQRDEEKQEKWYEKTRYQVLLFAGGIALFGLVLGVVLDWYINPKSSTEKKDMVQALGLITAGVAGAVGIFFTWRGQRLAREAQEANQRNTQEHFISPDNPRGRTRGPLKHNSRTLKRNCGLPGRGRSPSASRGPSINWEPTA